MAKPTNTPLSSPLVSAFNNIVNINRSKSTMRSTQQSYNEFLRFMNVEIKNIKAIKLPEERQVKKLSNINVASTFGSAGSLLSSLANGALDAAGLVGSFFGGKGNSPKAEKPVPKGRGIRLGGVKAIGIANAVFAGLDFSTGLAEGESVGKAASGAGGALAGSLLGGAIGQALIPVPGLGFVIGSMAGNFLGGYLGDRTYEAVTGEGKVKEKVKAKLKQQEQKQKLEASVSQVTLPQVLDKFESIVVQFEKSVSLGTFGSTDSSDDVQSGKIDEEVLENDAYGDRDKTGSDLKGNMQDLEASGGSLPSSKLGSKYGMRFHPIYKVNRMHNGNDYPMPTGTAVSVIQPGKVANAGFVNNGYGNQVKVDHPGGVSSFYAHLSSVNVSAGQDIAPGTVIGKVGSTGASTGPHLHFEVDANGKTTDPTPYQDKIFRFGGNVKVKPSIKPQQNLAGQDVQSQQQNKSQISQQELSKMPTDQLKGMFDSTVTGLTTPAVVKVIEQTRTKGKESGVSGEALEREVMIAGIRAKNAESQVIAMSQQPVIPEQIQQYPDYNTPQNNVTIIPMMMGGPGGGSQQRPMVISSGGGGGGTTIMPPVPQSQLLNSFFNTMLLTNLSGT